MAELFGHINLDTDLTAIQDKYQSSPGTRPAAPASNPMAAFGLFQQAQPAQAPAVGEDYTSDVDFKGLHTKKDNAYLNKDEQVADVTPNKPKNYTTEQREAIQTSAMLTAKKDSIAIFRSGETMNESTDITETASTYDVIRDGGIDREKAKTEQKKLEKANYQHLDTKGIDEILKNDRTTPVQLNENNYAKYGIEVEDKLTASESYSKAPTDRGEAQIKLLREQGIITRDEKTGALSLQQGLSEEQTQILQGQKLLNGRCDDLKLLADNKATVAVKTANGTNGANDTYSATTLDKKGNIQNITDKTVEKAHTESKVANQKIKIEGLDNETIAKMLTVDAKGKSTFNIDKLSDEEYSRLKVFGLEYKSSDPITLRDSRGEKFALNITGKASQVKLEGKTQVDIATANKALEIKAGNDAKIAGIGGNNLEHLVVKGGNIDSDLSNLDKLNAVKLERGTTLNKGLSINNTQGANVVLNMNGVKVAQDQKTKVTTTGNTEAKIENSQTGDVTLDAQNAALLLSGKSTAGTITLKAKDEASFRGYRESKAENLIANSKDFVGNLNDAQISGSTDMTGVTDKARLFIGKYGTAGNLKLKDNATESNTELVHETQVGTDQLTRATGIQAKTIGNGENQVHQKELMMDFFRFSEAGYNAYIGVDEGRPQNGQFQHGSTPGVQGFDMSNFYRAIIAMFAQMSGQQPPQA